MENLTIKELLAVTIADVNIFLLQNEEQTSDLEKDSFTKEEIRKQLQTSLNKVVNTLSNKLQLDLDTRIPYKEGHLSKKFEKYLK